MSLHTVLLCDTGHYSLYYSQPFTTLITWKILRPIVSLEEKKKKKGKKVQVLFLGQACGSRGGRRDVAPLWRNPTMQTDEDTRGHQRLPSFGVYFCLGGREVLIKTKEKHVRTTSNTHWRPRLPPPAQVMLLGVAFPARAGLGCSLTGEEGRTEGCKDRQVR